MKINLLMLGMLLSPLVCAAQETRLLDSIVINATRASKDTPLAHSTLSREALQKTSPVENFPFALTLSPGVVAVGENGTGSGYAYLRIRGSEGSRINVNLNGITLNDAESQEVFWVNLPALSGFLQSAQIQRGIGTSANGTGSFGANVNLQTVYVRPTPYVSAEASGGSYGTLNTAVAASTSSGTAFLPQGLSLDVRLVRQQTDGYIRNGYGRLYSLFSRVAWVKPKYALKLYYIYGEQHTGITWEGISAQDLATDRRSNPAGAYYDASGALQYYPNQTDNYTQHHVQVNYTQTLTERHFWSTTLHFTKGGGYYEQYKEEGDNDYVVRRSMDNAYLAVSSVLSYVPGGVRRVSADMGVNYSAYLGQHFGLRTEALPQVDFAQAAEYYRNRGNKYDFSAFAKMNYTLALTSEGFLKFFTDLQWRRVQMEMVGPDNDGALLDYAVVHPFFNPKAGVTYAPNSAHRFFASVAYGQREPSRSDIKESVKAFRTTALAPEKMCDFEAGYKLELPRVSAGVTLYAMEYDNQLVPTGLKSDTGYEIKENVKDSYRRGMEWEARWTAAPWFSLEGNVCLSRNKIKNLTLYLDTYDNPDDWNPVTPQVKETYALTDLIYSPSFTGAVQAVIKPFAGSAHAFRTFELTLTGHLIGKQYYDNTSSDDRSLPAYRIVNLKLSQTFATRRCGAFEVNVYLNNLFNKMYCASAWAYRAAFVQTGTIEQRTGFYPQAGLNAMVRLAWSWQ